jgi:dTDP-glucose pyrophosphorylase
VSRHLDLCRVHVSGRIVDALRCLDRSGTEIALVVDDVDHLEGTMTDGDIRRALLSGASMDSPLAPYIQRDYTSVGPNAMRAEVLDLMQARVISGIPILGDGGELLGLHLIHEILGAIERPNCAVVMAGGRGTRLGPLTEDLPKPMLRVAGRPILERIVLHLVGFGIRRIFLSINYLGHIIEEHFGDGSGFGCQIEYLREQSFLGTGGSLALLSPPPNAPVLVMNGDLVTQADLGSMLAQHEVSEGVATVAVRRYFHTVPFGTVELTDGRLTVLEEKPQICRLVNAGIYVLNPELIARVPSDTEYPLTSLLTSCIARDEPVYAFEIEDDWIDVGQREHLARAAGREP